MGQKVLRELDIRVNDEFFGYSAEVTPLINGQIAAVRMKKNGMRSYLPEYSTNMNDSFLILGAIKKMGGVYRISCDRHGVQVTAMIHNVPFSSAPFEEMGEAICDLALAIASYPLYRDEWYPSIEDKEDKPQTEKPVVVRSDSIKRAWYDAR